MRDGWGHGACKTQSIQKGQVVGGPTGTANGMDIVRRYQRSRRKKALRGGKYGLKDKGKKNMLIVRQGRTRG